MVVDAINSWDKNRPAGTDYIDASDELIRVNQAAVEEMVGGWIQDLVVTNGGSAGQIDIDATRLGLVKDSGTPPLVFVDRSINLTCDWANGEAINGREVGLPTTVGWKYLWVLRDPVAGTTGSLFSAATAVGNVVMPGDYEFGRLVGAAYWDGATDFTPFLQNGNSVSIKTPPLILNAAGSDETWGQLDLSAVIPAITYKIYGYGWGNYSGNGINFERMVFRLAANGSGDYKGFDTQDGLGQILGANKEWPIGKFSQRVLSGSQSIYYYTAETFNSCFVNGWLEGYLIKI